MGHVPNVINIKLCLLISNHVSFLIVIPDKLSRPMASVNNAQISKFQIRKSEHVFLPNARTGIRLKKVGNVLNVINIKLSTNKIKPNVLNQIVQARTNYHKMAPVKNVQSIKFNL